MYTAANEATINQLIAGGNGTAWNIADEPGAADFQNVATNTQWMNANHPDLLTYVTEGGGQTTSFLQSLVNTVHPDLLMFDDYPLHGTTDTTDWFLSLMKTRQVSLAANIPYGAWLQSFVIPGEDLRTPSESDTRYQGFSLLAAGYTMLNYFTYDNGVAAANHRNGCRGHHEAHDAVGYHAGGDRQHEPWRQSDLEQRAAWIGLADRHWRRSQHG